MSLGEDRRIRRKPDATIADSLPRHHRIKRLLGDKGSLAGLASRALAWSFLSTALGRIFLTGFGIVLARLLGPHEYGTVAVA